MKTLRSIRLRLGQLFLCAVLILGATNADAALVICQSATLFSGYSPARHDLQNPVSKVYRDWIVSAYPIDNYAAWAGGPCSGGWCKMLRSCLRF